VARTVIHMVSDVIQGDGGARGGHGLWAVC
jgi:hypothetical protein